MTYAAHSTPAIDSLDRIDLRGRILKNSGGRASWQVGLVPKWNDGRFQPDTNCHPIRRILPRMPVSGPRPNMERVPSGVPLLKIKPFHKGGLKPR